MSPTDIANLALSEIGNKDIANIADNNNEARWCRKFYDSCRDQMLRSGQWNFAMKRVALSESATTPLFGWTRQFALPEDFIRGVSLNELPWNLSSLWIVETGKILTNCDGANLRYVFRQTDTTTYDPLFTVAFSVLLAARIAEPITGDRSKAGELINRFVTVDLPNARRIDANEEKPRVLDATQDSKLVNSRFISGYTSPGGYQYEYNGFE